MRPIRRVGLTALFLAFVMNVCVASAQTTTRALAEALDIPPESIVDANLATLSAAANSVAVQNMWGTSIVPLAGNTLAVLSTGRAADASTPGFVLPRPGPNFGVSSPDPFPQSNEAIDRRWKYPFELRMQKE